MRLYNSLTNKIEKFIPLKAGHVSMYVCGPTVYNDAHIGNARPIVVFDLLRRVFETQGYQVKYVSNITDVDDKIIAQAIKLGISETELAKKYTLAYEKLRQQLQALPLAASPAVTEAITPIIEFITNLIKQGFAYEVAGDVYFRVSKITEYGELSKQNTQELLSGARVDENLKKENPLDFTLWKQTTEGISWPSPWSNGRPGWHTECVVMINQEFHQSKIDIHGGGSDLRFPHHENERAQALAVDHSGLANYWIHNGMVSINDAKMSKSLGNIVLAKDVVSAEGSNVARWLLLSAHYRDTLKYNTDTLALAKNDISKLTQVIDQIGSAFQRAGLPLNGVTDASFDERFLATLLNDLNTPNAYSVIYDLIKELNRELRKTPLDYNRLAALYLSLQAALAILGIKLEPRKLTEADLVLFQAWEQAKKQKDYQQADVYRTRLMEQGLL